MSSVGSLPWDNPTPSLQNQGETLVPEIAFSTARLALLRAPALCIPARRLPSPCCSRLLHHADEWVAARRINQKLSCSRTAQLPDDVAQLQEAGLNVWPPICRGVV